jgi:hypothetical protein
VIDDTVALQYRIALYASGMVDGPPGRLTTLERLSLLRSYETSWKNLDWNAQTSLPIPDGNLWELYGNVWAHSIGADSIDFVQIPSRLRGIPLRQWTLKLDSPMRDFTMDPSQDLLVTIGRATKCVWLTFGRDDDLWLLYIKCLAPLSSPVTYPIYWWRAPVGQRRNP